MPSFVNHAGTRFGRLVILRQAPNNAMNQTQWHCRCDCGSELTVRTMNFVSGNTKSCGCYRSDAVSAATARRNTTHGASKRLNKRRSYIAWVNMIQRCTNPNASSYSNYGGRGISVCERWQSYAAFISDMGEPPLLHSLERRDVNGHYGPDNCEWATTSVQARNRRDNRYIEYGGQSLLAGEWAEKIGIPRRTIVNRLKLGWSVEEALSLRPSPLPKNRR